MPVPWELIPVELRWAFVAGVVLLAASVVMIFAGSRKG